MFLRDVEEDSELRSTFAIYKAQQAKREKDRMEGLETESVAETEGSEEDEVPKIDMNELLDEFDELNVEDEDEE